jgi:hypothetical protein
MRDRIGRLPSPSMAVAFIALLAALGGTAVALPGTGTVNSGDIRNSTIRTQDIKNNSGVRTQDIRNSTIRGRDVRNNTLRGNDINEASLGIVPSATNANTATRAISADRAGAVNGRTPFLIKLAAGQTTTIASNGPVSIQARCTTGGGFDTVQILGATTAPGSALGGNDDFEGSAGNTLEPTTAPDDREILSSSDTAGQTEVNWNIDSGWVMAPDGKSISIDGETTPLGVNYAGAKCVVSGIVNTAG